MTSFSRSPQSRRYDILNINNRNNQTYDDLYKTPEWESSFNIILSQTKDNISRTNPQMGSGYANQHSILNSTMSVYSQTSRGSRTSPNR